MPSEKLKWHISEAAGRLLVSYNILWGWKEALLKGLSGIVLFAGAAVLLVHWSLKGIGRYLKELKEETKKEASQK